MKDASRLDWSRITSQAIDRIRQELAAKYEVSTANRVLTALRQVLRFCWRDGLLTHEELKRLVDVKQLRGEPTPRGRALGDVELERLYGVCAADPTAADAVA